MAGKSEQLNDLVISFLSLCSQMKVRQDLDLIDRKKLGLVSDAFVLALNDHNDLKD